MSGYRDELEAARMRVSTLEARLEEREAALRARDAELAERDAKIARLVRESFAAGSPEAAQKSGRAASHVLLAVLGAGAVIGGAAVLYTLPARREPTVTIANATCAPPSPIPPSEELPAKPVLPEPIPPVDPTETEPLPEKVLDFDRAAVSAALAKATTEAKACAKPDDPPSQARIKVIFAPAGRVVSAALDSSVYGGTPVGGCIAAKFRAVTVPRFHGSTVAVSKSFTIP
jgi:hypothetical protein